MAVLVGCGVPTGWGSAVNTANVAPGDKVAVYGVGGIGINAVQGARYAGAKNVVAIDPLENKRYEQRQPGGQGDIGRCVERAVAPAAPSTRAPWVAVRSGAARSGALRRLDHGRVGQFGPAPVHQASRHAAAARLATSTTPSPVGGIGA